MHRDVAPHHDTAPMRTCDTPDCDRPHRARGLCSTHYNRAHYATDERHPKVTVPCTTCGEPATKDATTTGRYAARFCSYLCRDLWRLAEGHYDQPWRALDVYPRSALPADHPARWTGDTCELTYRRCVECDAWLIARDQRHIRCSKPCRERARARRRNNRHAALRSAVAAAHGTDCHICGDLVDLDAAAHQLDSPTVDHVIPRADGGTDDLDNLRLAHLYCNSVKGAQPLATVAC